MPASDSVVPQIRNAFKQKMKKLERMAMAVGFAEAGEFDTAKEMMKDEMGTNGSPNAIPEKT